MMNNPQYIIVHHTGGTDANPLADTSNHTFEVVNDYHKKLWNFQSSLGYYIGYHFFIDKKGKVTQGRAYKDTGAHTIGKNNSSIGICLAGNFDATDPTDVQVMSLRRLLQQLVQDLKIKEENIVPHRTFANKTCYGKRLSDGWARSLVHVTEPQMSVAELKKVREKLINVRTQVNAQIEAVELAIKKQGG